jgi:hypothetical protein
MARKTIYVRDEDEEVWKKAEQLAEQLAGSSLSRLIVDALRREVVRLEAVKEVKDGFERILIEYRNEPHGPLKKVAFNGKWLAREEQYDTEGIALTEKGQFFHYSRDFQTELGQYRIFQSFNDLAVYANDEENQVNTDLIAEAAEAIGEDYVEFLDI